MNNERIQVYALAKELQVPIGDIQFALVKLKLPPRQHAVGWISGQHADIIRRGLKDGTWRPRAKSEAHAALKLNTRPPRPVRWLDLTCTCCHLSFRVQLAESDPAPKICVDCLTHQVRDDEPAEVRWNRQEDHLRRTLDWTARVREKADEMFREKEEAFRTRNTWRRALVELVLAHGVGESESEDSQSLCECGEPFPCSVRRLLSAVNPGVASQVERFEDMHPQQRQKELNGEKWTTEDEYRYRESLAWQRLHAGDDDTDDADGDLSATRSKGH